MEPLELEEAGRTLPGGSSCPDCEGPAPRPGVPSVWAFVLSPRTAIQRSHPWKVTALHHLGADACPGVTHTDTLGWAGAPPGFSVHWAHLFVTEIPFLLGAGPRPPPPASGLWVPSWWVIRGLSVSWGPGQRPPWAPIKLQARVSAATAVPLHGGFDQHNWGAHRDARRNVGLMGDREGAGCPSGCRGPCRVWSCPPLPPRCTHANSHVVVLLFCSFKI